MLRSQICSLTLLLLPLAAPAAAGAWLRADGTSFVSASHERGRDDSSHTAFYAEHGLGGRNTIGFRLDHSGAEETAALMWLQRSLDDGAGPNRWTISLGLGALDRGGSLRPVGEVGAAWGRAISRPLGGGWLSVEARLNVVGDLKDPAATTDADARVPGYLDNISLETTAKADITLGLHVTPAMMLVNQVRLEEGENAGFSGRLSTSIVHDVTGRAKVELGLVTPLSDEAEPALRIGTWFEF